GGGAGGFGGGALIHGDFEIAGAAGDGEDLTGSGRGVGMAEGLNEGFADGDCEAGGEVVLPEVGDEVAEAIHFEDDALEAAGGQGRGIRRRAKWSMGSPRRSGGVPLESKAAAGAKMSRPWKVLLIGWRANCSARSDQTSARWRW